jgi:glycosyltransferase involved in cell wall biosynthesis
MISTDSDPLVSVVIPAFNAEQWIRETLESVLAQTYRDFEIIVVNDGSIDDTAVIAQSYGRAVRCVNKRNGGQSSARNMGIRLAAGKYVAFVDADDLWEPNKLELQIELYENNPELGLVYSDAYYFEASTEHIFGLASNNTKLYSGIVLRPLLLCCFIPSPTPVVQRNVFEHVGYFDESKTLQIGEDWNMWLRIASKYPVGCIYKPLAKYRCHPTSIISSMDLKYSLQSKLSVIEQAIGNNYSVLIDLRRKALARVYSDTTDYMLARGSDRRETRKLLRLSISLYPYSLVNYIRYILSFFPKSLLEILRKCRFSLRKLHYHIITWFRIERCCL